MKGWAHLFLNTDGAFGAGHVAWAFYWPTANGTWRNCYGSYDNTTSNPHKRKVWSDFANPTVTCQYFKQLGYDRWKRQFVPFSLPNEAAKTLQGWEKTGYFIVGSNCSDMANQILLSYGAEGLLRRGILATTPNQFFEVFPGSEVPMSSVAAPNRPQETNGVDDFFGMVRVR